MMKKLTALLLVAIMALGLLAGCGTTENTDPSTEPSDSTTTTEPSTEPSDGGETEKYYIAASHGYGAVQHWQIKTIGMEDAAAELGVEFIYKYADGDLQQEVADIENFVEMGVDYIIVGPCNSEGIVPTIEEAQGKGVAIGTCDIGIDGADAAALGAYALRVFCLGAAFAGASVVLESYCQSCGSERPAFWLATFRGALLLIPMTLLLSRFGPMAFWWLYPATEFGSLTLFLLIWRGRTAAQDLEAERILRRTIGSGESELSGLTAAVEEFCERWEASPKQSYFVTMSVEELCAVIQKKGLGGRPGVIQVTLIAQPDGVLALHIRDSAVSFNPFALDARRAGAGADFDPDALGVLVVREKAKEFNYRRYQGFNSLIVKI